MIPLDPAALEAAAKVLAFRDLAADPDWHGVYEEEWAAQPEEYREAWRESVREVLDPYLAAAVPAPTTENREDSFLTAGGCRVSADDCDRAGLSAAAHTLRLAAAVRRALQKLHDTGLLDVGTATGVALAAAQHATGENPYAGKAGALAVAWGEGFAAGRAAATPDPPEGCRAPHCWSEYGTPCGTCPVLAASADKGWSPGIDDPEPRALGDIDTGEGWYQT